MSASSIKSQYENYITTRGSPLFDTNPPTSSFGKISLDRIGGVGLGNVQLPSLCAGSSPSTSPAKPYLEWSSSYA